KGFHHIAFKSSHFKTSIAFYEGLGLIKKIMWGDREKTICMLDMGDGGCLELFSNGSEESPNGRFNHLAFLSDDVEGDFQRALSLGAKPHI
ncbi:MAG TPA: hypothetical protein DER23_07115, partial [Clostridiales bacterium]|nr:hypothetical protein [Clostridiales bacterium]